MFAINLDENKRILRATYEQYADSESILVEELPDGDITDYRFEDGAYVYDPLPKPDPEDEPTQLDIIEAQVAYTAMMTDTMLGV